ncbi:MAG TPA: cytosine permease, partial [Pseudonocardiaceae bacterium]|nr:cytosine permease [Pseudonocardiaceae bacterium]
LGVFVSCMVLELVGAVSVAPLGASGDNPTAQFTGQLPTWLADLTLLAIALGAVSANVLNIYSGAMSFLTLGVRMPLVLRRALVALVFGVIGFFLAWSGLQDAGSKYENFLLIIAYWIGPWLGVMFTDQFLRRGQPVDRLLYAKWYRNWAGPIAMATGILVSIVLFSNQTDFTGLVPKHVPALGDIAFLIGFLLSAGLYALLRPHLGAPRTTPPDGS